MPRFTKSSKVNIMRTVSSRLVTFLLCITAVFADTPRVYRSTEVCELIDEIVGTPIGILTFDDEYSLVSKRLAKSSFNKARFDLSKRKIRYMYNVWDCEDFSRYGANELKLHYRKHLEVNPITGWITYYTDAEGTLHARPFILVEDRGEIKLLTYEMTASVRYNIKLEELSETELESVRWVIM